MRVDLLALFYHIYEHNGLYRVILPNGETVHLFYLKSRAGPYASDMGMKRAQTFGDKNR